MLFREDIFIIFGLYMYISMFDLLCLIKIVEVSVDIDFIIGLLREIKLIYFYCCFLIMDDVRG